MLGNIFLLKRNNKLWNSSYFFVILSYHIDIFETKDNFKLSVSNLLSYLIFALSSCFWGKIILILSSNFAKFSFLTYLSKTVRCKTLNRRGRKTRYPWQQLKWLGGWGWEDSMAFRWERNEDRCPNVKGQENRSPHLSIQLKLS